MKTCALLPRRPVGAGADQCAKRHGLRRVTLSDGRTVPACAHHRAVLAQRGLVLPARGR